MTTRTILASVFSAAFALSCASSAQFVNAQRFDDGLYTAPASANQASVSDAELDNLLADSRSTQAYLADKQDSVSVAPQVVPAPAQEIASTTTVVNVVSPLWALDWYSPWYYYDWYRPYYYYSWYRPYYWRHQYYSWYDPWYYDSLYWHSSWYYHPYYYHHHHH